MSLPYEPSSLEVLSARRHQRLDCDQLIWWSLPRTRACGSARMLNIGLGGACIELPFVTTEPETIEITMGGNEAIHLAARAIWSSGSEDGAPARTGIQFQCMGDTERHRLAAWIQTLVA